MSEIIEQSWQARCQSCKRTLEGKTISQVQMLRNVHVEVHPNHDVILCFKREDGEWMIHNEPTEQSS